MFEESLIGAGYKKFKPHPEKLCSIGYQKSYEENGRVKYFLNCYVYDTPGTPVTARYWFECNMYLPSGDAFKVETVQWFFEETPWQHKVNTLQDVEVFYEKIWKSLNCKFY